MNVLSTTMPDVLIIEPTVFRDNRGLFYENYNQDEFKEKTGLNINFVQDNYSRSKKNVLRGMHYQIKQPQGKLVSVLRGEVFDVIIDLRSESSSFGKWFGVILSDENNRQLWIPPGFAHGFLVISESADFFYKTTDYYAPQYERCIRWDDQDIAIEWPIKGIKPILTQKDADGIMLKNAEVF